MSLAQGTDVLLPDEPIIYLDPSRPLEVLHPVRRLDQEEGKTVVVVLHDLDQFMRYSDEIIAVAGGSTRRASPQRS